MSLKKLISKECKHVWWIRATKSNPDAHVVKLVSHYDDGTSEPSVVTMVDYKRPFYVTRKNERNHEQKKEYEHDRNLITHHCTDSDLSGAVGKALGQSWSRGGMREHKKSPYLYGTDVSAAYLIKEKYRRKYGVDTNASYATIDLETNVLLPKIQKWVDGVLKWVVQEEILIVALAFKKTMQVNILKSFVAGYDDPITRMDELTREHLGKRIDEGLKYEYRIWKDEATMIKESFKQIHLWKPDFLGVHNGGAFDIPYIERRCKVLGINLADLWSDPDIHHKLRRYRFIIGKDKRTTAKGKVFTIPPAERWHVVEAPASFYVVDTMCSYRALRMFAAKESYALDALLKKETDTEKLKLDDTGLTGLALHKRLQRDMPLEYCIYGGWDTYSMLILDDATKDISISFPARMEAVEYKFTQTSSKKTGAFYHSFLRDNNCVIATAYVEEADDKVLSGDGWILTLPAYLTTVNGCKCLEESSDYITNIRLFNYDADIIASYPYGLLGCNTSMTTTKREVINITGTRTADWKRANLNLLSGNVNAVEYCYDMFSMPSLDEMVELCR